MTNRFFLKRPLYLIVLTSIISIILLLLLSSTIQLEEKLEKKMIELSTGDIVRISNNTAKSIADLMVDKKDFVNELAYNTNIQKNIENKISTLLTDNIKYSYLLYKDKKGVFRFLADATVGEEKAKFNQKFDIDGPQWLEIYEKKEAIFIKQNLLKQLSITYLIPIIEENEVKMILVVDFAIEKIEEINKIISFIKNAIIGIVSIVLFFLSLLTIQTIRFTMVKKSVYVDKLTELYNKNYLIESEGFINLSHYIMAAVDIDHFKKINDSYGHSAGDIILKQISQIILKTIRKNDDIAIRYGGEEFLLLIRTKRDNHKKALNCIDRIFQNIQNHQFKISNNDTIKLTISIGINLNPQDARTFSEAFKLSDMALYNAKTKGRNQIEIYSNEKDDNSFLSINDIKDSIEDKRIICFYQKILDVETKEVSHYEALLRIKSKHGNIITPDKIFPIIKGTFIARNISVEVLSIVHAKLLTHKHLKINVNLNPLDILDDSIIHILKDYAKEDSIPSRLGIELIETEEIANYETAKRNILMLKELGYKIYIDDFGSGYSNFIYLTEIQTDYIKIDGAIIKKILEDEISYLVIKSIVSFAKEANIKTIAEYVSSQEIYEKIKALNIDYAQGYLFSKPEYHI